MNEDRFWLLVSLKLSGEAQPEEIAELEMLLQQHPEMGLRVNMLNAAWQAPGKTLANNKDVSFNKHMQRLSNHFSEPVLQYENPEAEEYEEEKAKVKPITRSKLFWASGIAASILLVWFVAFYVPGKNAVTETVAQNTVSTKRGSKSKIQLPDGTQVWLNADSKITYNEKFQGALREVQLTGEAFFDVVRDETRPFVIHTNAIDVKVLGTSFNVRSYEDEKNTETSLIHGSVEVTLRSDPAQKKYELKPGQKLIVQNNGLPVLSKEQVAGKPGFKHPMPAVGRINYEKKDSSIIETLWVKNKLAFDGEAFEDVALKIERWFDVKVNITDEKLKKTPFTAVFDDESLQVVMEALQLTGKFKYNINKKEVTIGR